MLNRPGELLLTTDRQGSRFSAALLLSKGFTAIGELILVDRLQIFREKAVIHLF